VEEALMTETAPIADPDRVASRYEVEVICHICHTRVTKSVRVYGDNRRVSTCPHCANEYGWGGNG
jgi:hypothetical protein